MKIIDMEEELKCEIIQLIELIDMLLLKEKYPAYHQLKKNYLTTYDKINKNNTKIVKSDFLFIQSAVRIFLEAPPKDINLGKKILDKMQVIYTIGESLLNKQ